MPSSHLLRSDGEVYRSWGETETPRLLPAHGKSFLTQPRLPPYSKNEWRPSYLPSTATLPLGRRPPRPPNGERQPQIASTRAPVSPAKASPWTGRGSRAREPRATKPPLHVPITRYRRCCQNRTVQLPSRSPPSPRSNAAFRCSVCANRPLPTSPPSDLLPSSPSDPSPKRRE